MELLKLDADSAGEAGRHRGIVKPATDVANIGDQAPVVVVGKFSQVDRENNTDLGSACGGTLIVNQLRFGQGSDEPTG